MTLPVPLTVRVGDKHITREVSGVGFRKDAIGGVQSITLKLARPLDRFDADLAAYSRVYIYDARTAATVAEGRLSDTGRSASSSEGQQWDMTAFGPAQHASDETIPLVYFDNATDKWRRSEYCTPSAQTFYDEISINVPAVIIRPVEGQTVTTSWVGDMIHRAVRRSGMKLGRVKCDWDSGITNANYVLQLVTRAGSAAAAGACDTDTADTAGGTLSAVVGGSNFANGDDVVSVRVTRDTSSTTATENHFFHFYNFSIRALIYNADGTERTSGYSNDYLLAHEVVNDLLGRCLPQYDGANATVSTSATHQIDKMSYPDGVTAAQVLDDLMALEPAYRWTTGPSNSAGAYSFSWAAWPTSVRYEVTLDDGASFPTSAQELYTSVTVRWQGRDEMRQTTTRTGACPILDGAGITRTAIIDAGDEIGSTANADRLGDNFLAEHKFPANAGTLTVNRPIMDLEKGRVVSPHEIEPGELIRVRGVESYPDALNASSRDGQTVFRIWSMSYNSDSDSSSLELDTYSRNTMNALLRLARRRRRRR